MGKPIGTTGIVVDDAKWYKVSFHKFFDLAGSKCVVHVGDFSCCTTGAMLRLAVENNCFDGPLCFVGGPWDSFKVYEAEGPWDTVTDCGDAPAETGEYLYIITHNVSTVLMETFSLYPNSGGKYEMEIPVYGNAWGFFATADRSLKLHARFDSSAVLENL